MANNRPIPIPKLSDLAFEALLLFKTELEVDSTEQYEALTQYIIKKKSPAFLQSIANGDPNSVKNFLTDNPELAVYARGTVTTSLGNTYENVSAIELVYILDDYALCRDVLIPVIKELSENMIKKAVEQLAKKMSEVEKQRLEFKPYDFSPIVQAITEDPELGFTGRACAALEIALDKFNVDFEPFVLKSGKSFLKEHWLEGYKVYDSKWDSWNEKQLLWFLINIMGTMQWRAEKCLEQACCQGLNSIVREKVFKRIAGITHCGELMPYRSSIDGNLILSRDYYVDINYGHLRRDTGYQKKPPRTRGVTLDDYTKLVEQEWKSISNQLQELIHQNENMLKLSS